jgi:23S rRNA (pseudouridine1915-N3)-methyltransferase
MNIIINAIGKERSTDLRNLIIEYTKRIPWDIDIKEYICNKKGSVDEIKDLEAQLLLSKSNKNSFKIALDERGDRISSVELSRLIEKTMNSGERNIEFFIGGASGLAPQITKACYRTLSLSDMTFAHKLVRLIVVEQIYRAYTIINNHPYHK